MCLGDCSCLKVPFCTAVVVKFMGDTIYCVLFKLVVLLALEVTGSSKSVCLQYAMLLRMKVQHAVGHYCISPSSYGRGIWRC